MKRLVAYSLVALLSMGCASLPTFFDFSRSTGANFAVSNDGTAAGAALSEGSILISRPVPELLTAQNLPSAMGFVPSFQGANSPWLLLDRSANTASLMNGETATETTGLLDLADIPAGRYSVLLKSRNPLWYANDRYFVERDMDVPPDGSKDRFLRGALGDYAIYLSKNTAIHSSPAWSSDVGGVRIDDSPLSKFYYMLPVGAMIEVR